MTKQRDRVNNSSIVEYEGQKKTVREWAKLHNMTPSVLANRLQAGELMADAIDPKGTITGRGLRVECVAALLEEFKRQGLPKLPQEVADYLKTGKIGTALQFFKDFQPYLAITKGPILDGVEQVKEKPALFAIYQTAPQKQLVIQQGQTEEIEIS